MPQRKPSQIISRRYEIVCRLGEGGAGEVHKAHDRWTGRDVALKTVSVHVDQPALLQSFKNEFLLLTQLKHPGVVEALDFGYSEDTAGLIGPRPYFTMELVEGRSLAEACEDLCHPQRAPAGFERLTHLVWQACDILEFIHLRGIVHCDLKPDNLRVTDGAFRPKILDFGLSEKIGSKGDKQAKGTLPYMAPEMFKGEPLDRRSDLYSLGIILYEIVTSRLPFAFDDPVKIVSAHLEEDPTPPSKLNPQLPPYLDELILRLLSKSPAARPEYAAQVKEMLSGGLQSDLKKVHQGGLWREDTRLGHLHSGPMVGRKTEFATMERSLQRAQSDKGGCLFISGEQGVGKAFLLKQLQLRSQLQGMVLVDSNCLESQTVAYQPVMEILHKLEPYVENRCAAGTMADLRELFEHSSTDPSSLLEAQVSLHKRIAEVLISVSQSFPFVVVIQNLQWADLPTLLFLERFQSQIERGKILLCCSWCGEKVEENTPSWESIIRCLADKETESLKLNRFDYSTTRELICSKLIENQFDSEFFAYLYRRTSGNPFFVIELLKYLLENGLIYSHDSVWIADIEGLKQSEVPATIETALLKNLHRYDKRTVDLLSVLAVIGKRFTLRLLRELGLLDEDELPEVLSLLTRDQLLVRKQEAKESETWYEFANQSLQNLLYRGMGEASRTDWHRQIARQLEDASLEQDGESVFEIAFHYLEGELFDQAYRYALLCADRMEQRFANHEVLKYLQDAIEAASKLSNRHQASSKRTAVLMKRAQFCVKVGELNQAEEDYLAILQLTKDSSEHKTLVKAYNGLGEVCRLKHDYKKGISYLKQAMRINQKLNDPLERAHTLSFLGLTYWIDSQHKQALGCFQQALKIDRSLGNKFFEANTLNNIGLVHWSRRQYQLALKHFTDALSVYRELDNKEWVARTQNNVGATLFEIGDYGKCINHFLDSYRLNQETKNEKEMAFNLENLCEAYRKLGDHTKALEYGLQGLKLAREIEFTDRVGRILKDLGVNHLELGQYEEAQQYFREAKKVADDIQDKELQALVLINLARLATTLNDDKKAASLLEEAVSITDATGDHKSLILICQIKSSLKRRTGEFQQALGFLDKALALARKLNVGEEIFSLGLDYAESYLEQKDVGKSTKSLDQARGSGLERYVSLQPRFYLISGRIEWMSGRRESAEKAFRTALGMAEKLNHPEILWEIHHLLGKLLLSSRDVEGAYAELKGAAALLKRMSEAVTGERLKQNYLNDPKKKELLVDIRRVAKELVGETKLA